MNFVQGVEDLLNGFEDLVAVMVEVLEVGSQILIKLFHDEVITDQFCFGRVGTAEGEAAVV